MRATPATFTRPWVALVSLWLWLLCAAAQADGYSVQSALRKLQPEYPFIAPVTLLPDAPVRHWPAQTYDPAMSLRMDVFAPPTGTRHPGLLLIHGGGWQWGSRDLLTPLAQQLAMRGYVVASADYRLTGRASFPAQVHDVYRALAWLRAHADEFSLDAGAVALGGASAGGQLVALAALAADDDRLNPAQVAAPEATINIDGLWDFTDAAALPYENDPARRETAASRYLGGRFEQRTDRWRQASPLFHLHAGAPPVLVFTAADPRFSAGIERLQLQAEHLGVRVEREHLPAAPHSFWLFEPWFTPVLERIDRFLAQQLRQPRNR